MTSSTSGKHTFDLFPRLPTEVRLEVWRKCLPYRVEELDFPDTSVVYGVEPGAPVPCELYFTSTQNARPPVITRVCRESRAVAFETGTIPALVHEDFSEDQWESGTQLSYYTWVDTWRAILHLNWTPAYEARHDSSGNPLRTLAWFAARTSGGGSLMIEYFESPTAQFDTLKMACLTHAPKWMLVVRLIVVHADQGAAAATGLFGLLGDAPVQLVDVADSVKLNALLKWAEESERERHVTVKQDVRWKVTQSTEQRLKDFAAQGIARQPLLDLARPVIMFRLCTRMCNSVRTENVTERGQRRGRGRNGVRGRA